MTSAARMGSRRARRRDAAATRDALLAAGTELFAERGYDGVPVWAVAQKAGVNKAMINYHFGGKRKLYRAIVRSEEHTSELQSHHDLVCRLLLEKKKKNKNTTTNK